MIPFKGRLKVCAQQASTSPVATQAPWERTTGYLREIVRWPVVFERSAWEGITGQLVLSCLLELFGVCSYSDSTNPSS